MVETEALNGLTVSQYPADLNCIESTAGAGAMGDEEQKKKRMEKKFLGIGVASLVNPLADTGALAAALVTSVTAAIHPGRAAWWSGGGAPWGSQA